MRVGLWFDLRNPAPWRRDPTHAYGRVLDLCEEADQRGIGAIWLSEHHGFVDGYLPQPMVFAGAVATRTRRARIGTAVLLPALRPAATLAEEAAIVDILSGGRLELGLGAGYRRPEYDAAGADFDRRFAITDGRVVELRELWADPAITPKPIQDPVPLWLGYTGPKGARRAGRLGTGLLTVRPDVFDTYCEGLAEGGHPPGTARVGGGLNIIVADDSDAAWPRVRDHLAWQWDVYNGHAVEGTGRPLPRPVDPDRWQYPERGLPAQDGIAPQRYDVLTPGDAVAAIRQQLDPRLPVTDVYLWTSIAGMPDDLTERHVELVCDVVAPALRADPTGVQQPVPTDSPETREEAGPI
jgi:alkanesulfonate monooxygenase SsuD/methylene tetrahydromethanopterin reductase-like flavin-dependent oxidoreductase (luciferase family)